MEKNSQMMLVSCMGAMMKGILKGFNRRMSHIFVVKEREIEIGGPTDVKHVSHIGFDGSAASNSAPSWMGEFKTGPENASSSMARRSGSAASPWSSTQATTEICKAMTEASPAPVVRKKHRRKKHKKSSSAPSTSSSKATGRSSSFKKKSKNKAKEGDAKNEKNKEVAS